MDFSTKLANKKNSLYSIDTDCLVVGIYESKKLTKQASELNIDNLISNTIASEDISGKAGQVLLIRSPKGIRAKRLLLVGLGKHPAEEKSFRQAVKSMFNTVNTLNINELLIALPLNDITAKDLSWALYSTISEYHAQSYRCDSLKSKPESAQKLHRIIFYISSNDVTIANYALKQSNAIIEAMTLTRHLGDLPSNICTPSYLAQQAISLSEQYDIDVEILNEEEIKQLSMNSFLSVAKGSHEAPKFIVLKYLKGPKTQPPIVLVGKGITFDSGGISLKPGAGMDEMKYDMCGAATVLGTFLALAKAQTKQNIIGLIPTCENMPSGHASKPGDIVTSMSGQTIEILNTDAEGRLILCDALTYAERFSPEVVIDLATLTGACVVALGHINSGLFTRDDPKHNQLAKDLLDAASVANDPLWRMPVSDEYQDLLKSKFADMANVGGREAGATTAACFLEKFTKKYTWAHLDIAGTAWSSGANKGATGRPVALLCKYIFSKEK